MNTTKRPFPASALITGGTSGVGLETAAMLAAAGTRTIVINGRNEDRGEAACAELRRRSSGTNVHFISADVTDIGAVGSLLARTAELTSGKLDVLMNSTTAEDVPELFHNMSAAVIERIVRHLLVSPMQVCRAALPLLSKGSAIVNVASDAAKVATPGETVIGAAMAGIVMFSRGLAMEARRQGIRVNALTPSLIQGTPTHDRVTAGGFSAKLFSKATAAAHLGLPGPADVAEAAFFLLSPAAAHITGQAVSVNGGISAA